MENQGLRAKYERITEVPLLYYGIENELYDGEIRDQVLEVLNSYLGNIKKKTRKEHILQDILEYNEPTGTLSAKREEIKHILKQALTNRINDREVYMKGIDHSYYYEGYSTFKISDL